MLQEAVKELEVIANIKAKAVGHGPVAGSLATILRHIDTIKKELLKISRYERISETVIIMHDDGSISRKSKYALFEDIQDDTLWEAITK